tara:strand:+ start:2970 stop:3569 length:600 start_codon:yes stop_codon:yes gene_type:complete
MPERVTREERKISMAIQKARDAKEVLYQSVMDNNRSPMRDESEVVKLKRPKAEKDTTKFESNDGPTTFHAYAGEEMKKAALIIKAVLQSDYDTNPMLDQEDRRTVLNSLDETRRAIDTLRQEMKKDMDASSKAKLSKLIHTLNAKTDVMVQALNMIPSRTKISPESSSRNPEDSRDMTEPDRDFINDELDDTKNPRIYN